MRYIIDSIVGLIREQTPSSSEQLRIRISGFEDVRIYEAVAKTIHELFDGEIRVETRLAEEKLNEFKANGGDSTAILSLEEHNWITEHKSLTFYRNLSLDDAQLIILMGTEAVDDQGGLSDCFFIDPELIRATINGNYSLVFVDSIKMWNEDEKKCVDKIYEDLFSLVPFNLYALSNQADSWGTVESADDLLKLFYKNLPTWGICKMEDSIPFASKIINAKSNVLQSNYDFINRKQFKAMSQRQYAKYLSKIVEFRKGNNKYDGSWDGWTTQSVSDWLSYLNILEEFIKGQDIQKNRQLLLGVDFAITEAVLGIKLPTIIVVKKPKAYVVQGAPLVVFLKAIYTSLCAEDEYPYDELLIEFSSIELADAIDPTSTDDEDTQLSEAWKRVCYCAGGVIDYIADTGLEHNGFEVNIKVSDDNLFSPVFSDVYVSSGLISVASANKKLNKVKFDIIHRNNDVDTETKQSFEWNFTLHDDWVVSFDRVCAQYQDWIDNQIDAAVPLASISNYSSIMNSKCEEEFLDLLDDASIDLDFNICDLLSSHNESDKAIEWQTEFYSLGREFVNFCKSLTTNGFYADLRMSSSGNSQSIKFIDCYESIGKKIINSSFVQNQEWVLSFFVHAFSIESSKRALTTDEEDIGCIIPPYHPAILQKIIDQVVFISDGCQEWYKDNESGTPSFDKVNEAIDELLQLSQIQEGIDVFPSQNGAFFGTTRAFANYAICGSSKETDQTMMKSVLQKDAIFDDDFSDSTFKKLNVSAKMLLDVIRTYVKALPNSSSNLAIAIVDPDDLQPIIAAVYHYILDYKKECSSNDSLIQIKLNILVRPENKGGKNYLSYWANTFFSQDENVDIKIYLNEWQDREDLEKLLDTNLDLIFLMDVLKVNKLDFIQDNNPESEPAISDCRFPIVFKPTPTSSSSIKRRIELTQRQFGAATIHSQVVYYLKNYEQYDYQKMLVVKEVSIDKDRQELILMLHKKSNWVVCVDGGMDGALLRDGNGDNNDYSVIGFSTGKGPHGQYNLTVTARNTIINAVESKLCKRLKNAFHWDNARTQFATKVCMNEAKKLDGISLLSAINPKDHNINEFLAYVLSTLQANQVKKETALQVVVHLDSYQHWFDGNILDDEFESKSRPDFLMLTAEIGDNGLLHLKATVIECKIAQYANSNEHKEKALGQVQYGIERLSSLFNPNSKSIRRRYWFAQLYRALAFSQITFQSDTQAYKELSVKMRNILEGEFEIEWQGRIMGYWKDMPGESEQITIVSTKPSIELHEIPQKMIQRILLKDNNADVEYVPVTEESDSETVRIDDEELTGGTVLPVTSESRRSDSSKSDGIDNQDNSCLHPAADVTIQEPDSGTSIISSEADSSQSKKSLSEIRVFIGKDKLGNKVFWDFGNPKLANRHLLITGTSGQGKTYSIQAMLKELAQDGISSVIFDYTEGFREDQLEPAFKKALGGKISQDVIYFNGIPINPFRRHEIEVAGMHAPEKVSDVAQRIATIFAHVYGFKEQQFSAIYEACSNGINKYGDNMDISKFKKELMEVNNPAQKTVMSKMIPFFDSVDFQPGATFNWDSVTKSNGSVFIFQLTNYVREIQVIITEMMLWDAWHYFKKVGNKNNPFVVVLDEAQNLSMKMGSPAEVILREGRKFGWSAWFATQSLKSLSDVEVVNLHQAPYSLYFKPTDDEVVKISKQIDPATNGSNWTAQLKNLNKGQCIVVGDRLRQDGTFGSVKPTITSITSFEEREKDELQS